MSKEFFKNLPNTSTPLNASRLNGLLNGSESMGSIVVEDVKCKNLISVGNAKKSSNATLNLDNSNEQIKLNGTSTIETNINLFGPSFNKDKEGVILNPGTYTATIKKVSGSLSDSGISFYLRKSDGSSIYNGSSIFTLYIQPGVLDNTVFTETFTLTSETRLHWLGYFGEDLKTFDNLVLEFQIEEGTTATERTPAKSFGYTSGSNENGSWIKYDDGTLIQYVTKNINFAFSSTQKWGVMWESDLTDLGEFPIPFIDAPETLNITNYSSSGGFFESVQDTTKSRIGNAYICRSAETNGNISFHLSIIAKGRWK